MHHLKARACVCVCVCVCVCEREREREGARCNINNIYILCVGQFVMRLYCIELDS